MESLSLLLGKRFFCGPETKALLIHRAVGAFCHCLAAKKLFEAQIHQITIYAVAGHLPSVLLAEVKRPHRPNKCLEKMVRHFSVLKHGCRKEIIISSFEAPFGKYFGYDLPAFAIPEQNLDTPLSRPMQKVFSILLIGVVSVFESLGLIFVVIPVARRLNGLRMSAGAAEANAVEQD